MDNLCSIETHIDIVLRNSANLDNCSGFIQVMRMQLGVTPNACIELFCGLAIFFLYVHCIWIVTKMCAQVLSYSRFSFISQL